MTIPEAITFLHVSRSTLYSLMNVGELERCGREASAAPDALMGVVAVAKL